MYTLIFRETGYNDVLDYHQLSKFLDDNPNITFEELYMYDSLDSYLDTIESIIYLVPSVSGILKCSEINKAWYIHVMIKENLWRDDYWSKVSQELKDDPDVVFKVLDNKFKWFRTHLSFFSKRIRDNDYFAETMLSSRHWGGSCILFSSRLMKDKEFCEKIIQSPRWNGDLKYFDKQFILKDTKFIKKVMLSKKWDGCIEFFPKRLVNDPVFSRKIVYCKKWDGRCFYFRKKRLSDINFFKYLIYSPYWRGSCLGMFEKIPENRIFFEKIIQSPRWNGFAGELPLTKLLADDETFLDKILESQKWDGSGKFPVHLEHKVIMSEKWNGSITDISKISLSNKDFVIKIVKCPRWNKKFERFPRKWTKDPELCTLVMQRPDWKGSASSFNVDHSNLNFWLNLSLNSRWNRKKTNNIPDYLNQAM